jgi:hypothetical protein
MTGRNTSPKNGGKTRHPGQFKPGNGGGPGRPAGSRNRATLLLDKIADGDAAEILRKQLEKAKDGDARAAELILGRVWPARKSRPISLTLPPMDTAADIVRALGTIADAVAGGEITPDEGQAVAGVLEIKRRAIETDDLERRIAAIEQAQQERGERP